MIRLDGTALSAFATPLKIINVASDRHHRQAANRPSKRRASVHTDIIVRKEEYRAYRLRVAQVDRGTGTRISVASDFSFRLVADRASRWSAYNK